ncbi:MAG: T9SS type A sorting domain-containing protein [Saprospiraceae bacterium]
MKCTIPASLNFAWLRTLLLLGLFTGLSPFPTKATDSNSTFLSRIELAASIDGPAKVCSTASTVSYTALLDGLPATGGSFSIDPATAAFTDLGNGTAELDPGAAATGNYIIHYLDEGGTQTASLSVKVQAPDYNLVCNGQVNVSLQDNCRAKLVWTNVLLGSFTCLEQSDYVINVLDNISNGAVVDGCGTYKYEVSGPNGFSCWGYVTAEDKTKPELVLCPGTISGLQREYGYQPFVCDDLDKLRFSEAVTYTSDRDGNINYNTIDPSVKAILDITGYAVFTDNCGELTITVTDEVIPGNDPDCDDVTIIRSFTAKDACKGLISEICTQEIIVTRSDLDMIHCPESAALDCADDFKLDAKGNPHPEVTGYPWIYTAFDHTDDDTENYALALSPVVCNLGASYVDGPRIDFCEGSYKFTRTWQILDWCTKEIYECLQLIEVGDHQKPTVECIETDYDNDGQADLLTYSSGPYDCTAAFAAPLPIVSDNCSSWEVTTEIVAYSTNGAVIATILPDKPRYVAGIPIGCHYFKYTVSDDCGNTTVVYCPFFVEDQIAPIAICKDDLHVSIGGQGVARIYAEDIDNGSSDNCGPIRIEVRRRILAGKDYGCLEQFDYDGDGEVINDEITKSTQFGDPDGTGSGEKYWYTPWSNFVDFTCCDINEDVRIELRVWDDRNGDGLPGNTIDKVYCNDYTTKAVKDNYNVCWMDLLIEDKLPAYCLPPAAASIDCDKLPFDFDPANAEQMNSLFGAASGTDNCATFYVSELAPVVDNLNDCGFGYFTRRFRVADAQGQQSTNTCEQKVTIKEKHNYKIKFPKDAAASCGNAEADTIEVKEIACDLLAISVKESLFSASGDECYKIFRTYSVINWCEYDGISDPVVVSRDEDCDGKPGDEDIWVIVKTKEKEDPCFDEYNGNPASYYSHVWYDRDSNPNNQVPAAGTKGLNCDYTTNPSGFWKEIVPLTINEGTDKDDYLANGKYRCDEMASVGYWQYTQIIKVYDDQDPIVTYDEAEPFCTYSSDLNNDCPVQVELPFSINENCTPEDLTISLYLDEGRDGELDGEITGLYTGTYPDYVVKGNFPMGLHYIVVRVSDGCGNRTEKRIPFEVIDCKAPTPVCLNGLAVELMPVIPVVDMNGDGVPDPGAVTVWASDFIASPITDCTGDVIYSINRVGEPKVKDQTGLVLTCYDDATTLIEIWAYDGAGNSDLCETYVLVQDNQVSCNGGLGHLSGAISTEDAEAMEGVDVELSGGQFMAMQTKADGNYSFEDLEPGFDYTVTPNHDKDYLNGLSTFDLVLMTKHALGLQPLDSPYKRIAADVNNDQRITALDAIAMRRMLLHITDEFENNTSWRFIPADYIFPDPENPWKEAFPEVININALPGDLEAQDFIALKVGDIDLNAQANALSAESRTTNGRFLFQVDAPKLEAGQVYRIPFRADDLASLQGYQMTLNLAPVALELVDIEYGLTGPENFGLRYLDEGLITTSWNQLGSRSAEADQLVFTLVVKALQNAKLSDVLSVSNRLTRAEAYDQDNSLLDVGIEFVSGEIAVSGFELTQNTPNPFRESTTIGFYLPEDAQTSLKIYDLSGRVLKVINQDLPAGRHQIVLDRAELAGNGLLYYTLTAGPYAATRKMIVVDGTR